MNIKTKQRILDLLKMEGPTSQESLAKELELSTMAVSKHLTEFQKQDLVTFDEEKQDRGRPVKKWKLTAKSQSYFPDNHPQLANSIWQSATEVFGQDAIEKILSNHTQKKISEYQEKIPDGSSLGEKVKILSELREKEGYMSSYDIEDENNCSLVEHNCPICLIASNCKEFCGSEVDLFQNILGHDIKITREESILEGDHRCKYNITKQ